MPQLEVCGSTITGEGARRAERQATIAGAQAAAEQAKLSGEGERSPTANNPRVWLLAACQVSPSGGSTAGRIAPGQLLRQLDPA